ncbi:odorant receptor 82a-like [Anopheles bellator]|uniref:odorant receptor 82a-like n=1 Tax=Anopheles bellator TaxID=139047 RepID=UPI0026474AE5|nr:odorant receptor 82a-like [Anopheles bellator]
MAHENPDFFRVQSLCFSAIGVGRRNTGANKVVYFLSFSTVLFMKLGTVMFAIKHANDIMPLCDCLGPTFTAYLGLVRQHNLRSVRQQIWEFVHEFTRIQQHLRPSEQQIVEKYNRIALHLTWAYLISAMVTGTLFVGSALLKFLVSETPDYRLPLLMYFPFSISHPVTFAVFFIWCSVAIFWVVLECVACDSSFGTFCSGLLAHFIVIQRRFEEISTEEDFGSLNSLIQYHAYILGLSKRVISAYKFIILNQLLVSSLLLCMLGFQLVISAGSSEMVVYIAYGMAITIQITYYCYYGSLLEYESLQVHNAVFRCNWYNATTQTQKMLINCMMRSSKPVIAKAGFTQANLPTLNSILNSAGSYVALLMSLLE